MLSDNLVYLAMQVGFDCAMLIVSLQVAVRALRLAYLAFRFRLSRSSPRWEDMIRSFYFAPHRRTLDSLQTLACSLPRFRFSFARFSLTLLFLASPNLTARLNMPLGDNDQEPSTVKRSCRIHRKSRKGCANCKARRVKVPQTQTIPTALAMQHIGLSWADLCLCEV